MTGPCFETGAPRCARLHRVVAVAEGRVLSSAVAYRVCEFVNG
jgi:hypothetical protein